MQTVFALIVFNSNSWAGRSLIQKWDVDGCLTMGWLSTEATLCEAAAVHSSLTHLVFARNLNSPHSCAESSPSQSPILKSCTVWEFCLRSSIMNHLWIISNFKDPFFKASRGHSMGVLSQPGENHGLGEFTQMLQASGRWKKTETKLRLRIRQSMKSSPFSILFLLSCLSCLNSIFT